MTRYFFSKENPLTIIVHGTAPDNRIGVEFHEGRVDQLDRICLDRAQANLVQHFLKAAISKVDEQEDGVVDQGMDFSQALVAMKRGHKVSRAGWNGKGMWICLGKRQWLEPEAFWNKHTRKFAEDQVAVCEARTGLKRHTSSADFNALKHCKTEVLPYFIMKTADDKILMGWLASQTDLLADDWGIVED